MYCRISGYRNKRIKILPKTVWGSVERVEVRIGLGAPTADRTIMILRGCRVSEQQIFLGDQTIREARTLRPFFPSSFRKSYFFLSCYALTTGPLKRDFLRLPLAVMTIVYRDGPDIKFPCILGRVSIFLHYEFLHSRNSSGRLNIW